MTTLTTDAPRPPLVVSIYAASPAHQNWDPDLEATLFQRLTELPGVTGLELPWLGAPHPHDNEWLFDNLPAGAQVMLTPLPFIMRRCVADPGYGIASPSESGRRAALSDLEALARGVHQINERSSARVTVALLHTAPQNQADPAALRRSLMELATWDWDGARLAIEHCDAAVEGQSGEKRFLDVASEIRTIAHAETDIGIWLNWGRSAIELRDAEAVTAQIADVSESGLLAGLTFSGAAAVAGPYGAAWEDRHLPISSTDRSAHSLLDDAHVLAALRAAPRIGALGVKVSRRPSDRTADDIARTIRANITTTWSAWDRLQITD